MAPGPREGTRITTTHSTVTTPKTPLSPATQQHALPAPSIITTHTQLHITTRAVHVPSLLSPHKSSMCHHALSFCDSTITHHEDAHWTAPFSSLLHIQAVDKTPTHPLPRFPRSLKPYLKSLLPEVLGPQHSESSCANESRHLAQHRGLRLTISHQSHHPAIHTDCHTVPPARGQSRWGVLLTPLLSGPQLSLYSPAIHEVDLLREGTEGVP